MLEEIFLVMMPPIYETPIDIPIDTITLPIPFSSKSPDNQASVNQPAIAKAPRISTFPPNAPNTPDIPAPR